MKIVVDAFASDKPSDIIKGCVDSLCDSGFGIVLTGDKQVITQELDKYRYDTSRIDILDCKEIITNDMRPTDAIRTYKDSSLMRAIDLLKSDDSVEGMISAGNTGAVLVGATLQLGRLQGISRPALAPLLPTAKDNQICLVDCGANVDCKPEWILQFAILGDCYMRCYKGIDKPRIGLLSNGSEDKKGNEVTKATFELLKASNLNFKGNVEGRYALNGEYDIIVCDGFVGNVFLKTLEGAASMVMNKLKETLLSGGLGTKLGAALVKKRMMTLRDQMNYHAFGGAPCLGVGKPLVKAHGSSNADNIKICVGQVRRMIDTKLIHNINESIALNGSIQSSIAE